MFDILRKKTLSSPQGQFVDTAPWIVQKMYVFPSVMLACMTVYIKYGACTR